MVGIYVTAAVSWLISRPQPIIGSHDCLIVPLLLERNCTTVQGACMRSWLGANLYNWGISCTHGYGFYYGSCCLVADSVHDSSGGRGYLPFVPSFLLWLAFSVVRGTMFLNSLDRGKQGKPFSASCKRSYGQKAWAEWFPLDMQTHT